MFTNDDVKDLIEVFPLDQLSSTAKHHGFDTKLLLNARRRGFTTTKNVEKQLESLLSSDDASNTVSLSTLAKQIDVTPQSLRDVLIHSRTPRLLSVDHAVALSRSRQEELVRELFTRANEGQVFIEDYEKIHQVHLSACFKGDKFAAYNQLGAIAGLSERLLLLSTTPSSNFVCTDAFDRRLRSAIEDVVAQAEQLDSPVDLKPTDFPECPPDTLMKLVQQLHATSLHGKGELSVEGDVVRFTPQSHIRRLNASLLTSLLENETPYCTYDEIATSLSNLDETTRTERLVPLPHDAPLWVVNSSFLDTIADDAAQQLRQNRHIDLSEANSAMPTDLTALSRQPLMSRLQAKEDFISTPLAAYGDFVFTGDLGTEIASQAESIARSQARRHWEEQLTRSAKEAGLDIEEVEHDMIRDVYSATNLALLAALINGKLRVIIEQAYEAERDKLQAESEAAFATYWLERSAKIALYQRGLDAITDNDLRTALSELLFTHLTRELIPEAISKARTKGLLRGRKTSKELTKLSKYKEVKNVSEVWTSVEKFNRAIGLPRLEEAKLATFKASHIAELQRGMQKDKDGPRLFLSLVVLLTAQHLAGITYATGKFAPKLLKILKGSLDPEVYTEVNGLKEKVKTGILSKEDRERMRELAARTTVGQSIDATPPDSQKPAAG